MNTFDNFWQHIVLIFQLGSWRGMLYYQAQNPCWS